MTDRWGKKRLEGLMEYFQKITGFDHRLDYIAGHPRMVNRSGDRDISPRLSKRKMAEWIYAFLEGFEASERKQKEKQNP